MAIGNHTTWILVDTDTREAVTDPKDKRVALHFRDADAALAYKVRHNLPSWVFIVKLPA